MSKTEEQSGMTMEQMEAGKIEEKKREAEAAVAQSEAASKKRREGKRVRVPVRFKKPLDSSSPNYRNLTLAMERDGFAEPLVEGSYPSFEVLIYEDDLELLDKFCGVKGLDILDHRMEELPESRSATTIVGDFSLELLLKAIREANPGCFVTGKQVHGKVQDPMMKVFRVLCVVRGPPVWPSVVAGRRPIFAGERSEQFENVPGKTVARVIISVASFKSAHLVRPSSAYVCVACMAYRQEVCALGSEQAVRRPAPQTIEQIVRNALRTNLGNNELEMLIYCFIIGAMSTSVLDSPAPGQALAPAPGSADPVAAVAPAPLVPSPVVGGAAEEASAETPAKMDALPMVGNTALSLGCAGNMLDEAKAWAESVGAQVMSATPSAGERTTFLSNEMVAPEALFAAWKRQRTSTTNVGVTPCGRSLVLEVRGPVERAVTRPVKVPVRSASREVEVRWRLAPSAAKKTEDLGWRSGRSEMELEVALQAALDEGTIADASAVKWDSGMVFAAPADLVSLKVALFRMEKMEKARPAFIGGKAPCSEAGLGLRRVRPPCSGDAGVSPAPGDVADAVSAGDADSGHAGDGAGYAARGWGGEECPWREGDGSCQDCLGDRYGQEQEEEAQPKRGDVRRTRITTRMHMGMGRRIGNDEGPLEARRASEMHMETGHRAVNILVRLWKRSMDGDNEG
ncbi:hypothetical protein PAPYR_4676 [Paratrimastix pyriformis]|uniref:Uncharacterized protein n=1 Tax=Paratrimastix pyriformis TaxID=342808 RepID=A0ABQ8UJI0_9EUKA|nr:hypothetical protein PAPYR_4676 [Paratrimastix pyriformis]